MFATSPDLTLKVLLPTTLYYQASFQPLFTFMIFSEIIEMITAMLLSLEQKCKCTICPKRGFEKIADVFLGKKKTSSNFITETKANYQHDIQMHLL